MEDDLKKPVVECEDPECRDHTVILYEGLSNQRTTCSSRRRSGKCRSGDSHLEWPPRITGFIYERNVPEGSDYFQLTLGRRRSSTNKKRRRIWEQLKIKLSPSKE